MSKNIFSGNGVYDLQQLEPFEETKTILVPTVLTNIFNLLVDKSAKIKMIYYSLHIILRWSLSLIGTQIQLDFVDY